METRVLKIPFPNVELLDCIWSRGTKRTPKASITGRFLVETHPIGLPVLIPYFQFELGLAMGWSFLEGCELCESTRTQTL